MVTVQLSWLYRTVVMVVMVTVIAFLLKTNPDKLNVNSGHPGFIPRFPVHPLLRHPLLREEESTDGAPLQQQLRLVN